MNMQMFPMYPGPAPEIAAMLQERERNKKLLFRLGLIEGIGFLGYLLLRSLFILALSMEGPFRAFYQSGPDGETLVNMIYSYFVVGVPFLIVWLVLRRQKEFSVRIPFGKVLDLPGAVLLVFVGIGVCFIGDIATNYFAAFAESVGFTFNSYQQALQGQDTPTGGLGLVLFFLQGAVIPAFVEEFVFRGVVMQPLRKFGDWFAILVSAILFGLMHGNMTQVPFALLAGLALGYCATVTGTLWTSILIHFLNNLFAVATAVVSDQVSEGAALLISNVCIFGFIGLGVLAFVFFVLRTPAWRRLYPGIYRSAPKGRFFLAPTLLISVILMAIITLADISVFSRFAF